MINRGARSPPNAQVQLRPEAIKAEAEPRHIRKPAVSCNATFGSRGSHGRVGDMQPGRTEPRLKIDPAVVGAVEPDAHPRFITRPIEPDVA